MLLDILPPNRELLDPSGGNFPPHTDQEMAPVGDVTRKEIRRIYKRVPTPLCKAPSQTKLLSTFILGRSDNNVGFAFILAVGLIGLDLILLARLPYPRFRWRLRNFKISYLECMV